MSRSMPAELLDLVAARFRALGEPARLQVLNVLRDGEMTVGALAEETGLGQANISKHLQLLHSAGFVRRRKAGLFAYYGLADRDVFRLCNIMCGRLGAEEERRRSALARPSVTPDRRRASRNGRRRPG